VTASKANGVVRSHQGSIGQGDGLASERSGPARQAVAQVGGNTQAFDAGERQKRCV